MKDEIMPLLSTKDKNLDAPSYGTMTLPVEPAREKSSVDNLFGLVLKKIAMDNSGEFEKIYKEILDDEIENKMPASAAIRDRNAYKILRELKLSKIIQDATVLSMWSNYEDCAEIYSMDDRKIYLEQDLSKYIKLVNLIDSALKKANKDDISEIDRQNLQRLMDQVKDNLLNNDKRIREHTTRLPWLKWLLVISLGIGGLVIGGIVLKDGYNIVLNKMSDVNDFICMTLKNHNQPENWIASAIDIFQKAQNENIIFSTLSGLLLGISVISLSDLVIGRYFMSMAQLLPSMAEGKFANAKRIAVKSLLPVLSGAAFCGSLYSLYRIFPLSDVSKFVTENLVTCTSRKDIIDQICMNDTLKKVTATIACGIEEPTVEYIYKNTVQSDVINTCINGLLLGLALYNLYLFIKFIAQKIYPYVPSCATFFGKSNTVKPKTPYKSVYEDDEEGRLISTIIHPDQVTTLEQEYGSHEKANNIQDAENVERILYSASH